MDHRLAEVNEVIVVVRLHEDRVEGIAEDLPDEAKDDIEEIVLLQKDQEVVTVDHRLADIVPMTAKIVDVLLEETVTPIRENNIFEKNPRGSARILFFLH